MPAVALSDFGALPPEVNSGRMYTGPGAGPMLTAATTWNGLAADLNSAASSYQSVISGMPDASWRGPASELMAAAAAPYVAWMSATAAQAQQAAIQAGQAVSAYEAAFAMTVPPPLIAANRAELGSLVATNIFGQNTPAIMGNEADYAEMWAQDAAAMYGYAGASAAAATVMPFTAPRPITSPSGPTGQSTAVARAAETAGSAPVQGALSSVSTVPQVLQRMAQPLQTASAASGSPAGAVGSLGSAVAPAGSSLAMLGPGLSAAGAMNAGTGSVAPASSAFAMPVTSLGSGLPGGLGSSGLGSTGAGAAVSASMGRAVPVGALSAPQSWAGTAPALAPAASAVPGTGLGAAPAASAASAGTAGAVRMPGLTPVPASSRSSWQQPYAEAWWTPKAL
ncbi:PPE family protein [Mycobacterium sp.]|uniref:PPE family protein n=1 Tax=Mycobacterium sp. TaxID=1785 RepID=UPI003BA8F696